MCLKWQWTLYGQLSFVCSNVLHGRAKRHLSWREQNALRGPWAVCFVCVHVSVFVVPLTAAACPAHGRGYYSNSWANNRWTCLFRHGVVGCWAFIRAEQTKSHSRSETHRPPTEGSRAWYEYRPTDIVQHFPQHIGYLSVSFDGRSRGATFVTNWMWS
jgi:hypothetical protein